MRQIIIDFGTLHLFGRDFSPRIYGYGLMLVLGFLLGVALARWRARRAGENPEALTACGILALIGGIVGARLAYVIEQWNTQFADAGLLELFNVTSGGLIYYGGVVLATAMVLAYLAIKRLPIRRYLDILAPSLMIGLAFGRAGCTLNGCCFGARCDADWALAMEFPMYSRPVVDLDGRAGPFSAGTRSPSPPYAHQFYDTTPPEVHPDPRLTNPYVARRVGQSTAGRLLPPTDLHGALTGDQLAVMFGPRAAGEKMFAAVAGADRRIDEREWRNARRRGDGLLRGSEAWDEALAFDSGIQRDGMLSFAEVWGYLQARRGRLIARFDADGDAELSDAERRSANAWLQADLYAVAEDEHSAAVTPAQPLGMINALLLAAILLAFSRIRRREGQVFALLVILYPITRFVLESIRADNRHAVFRGILTHNQYTSIVLVTIGIVMWVALYRFRPSAGPAWGERAGGAPDGAGG